MVYSVKKLGDLAGVSVRTLHYYDEIGLLKPANIGENGYRYYDEEAALKLQQIMFFKELNFSLDEIREMIDSPDFDLLKALETHKSALMQRLSRLSTLINTVDQTILYLNGQANIEQAGLFAGFPEAKQRQYEQEIRDRFGEKAFEGVTDWNAYSKAEKAQIRAEGEAIYRDLVANITQSPDSPAVQSIIKRWHDHLRYFYEPSIERLRGLADLYNEHPDFLKNFKKLHPDLPEFMRKAIVHYCATLASGSMSSLII
jgi:DNA-binding transcriptional MerR regulator